MALTPSRSCSDFLESIFENHSSSSLNVPEWSQDDVCEWVARVKFRKYVGRFKDKRVDGDLLLQMSEDQLKDEIGFLSEIERKRFMRELEKLKRLADYSSMDSTGLKSVLHSVGPELTVYTYPMLKAGVDSDSIRCISEDQLAGECGITNSIHRTRILSSMISFTIDPPDADSWSQSSSPDVREVLDVFISYEGRTRSAKLASLLKAHLEFKGYSVCLHPDRSASGACDESTLLSIKQAKNFLLVLTPESLDGCVGDDELNNRMHKEIVCAIEHDCNIIPVMDNFTWPGAETLPADMRDVPGFNGVRWVHDYKYACVDKVEKFMRGSVKCAAPVLRSAPNTPLMHRSAPFVFSRGNSSGAGERDATGTAAVAGRLLAVNDVNRHNDILRQTSPGPEPRVTLRSRPLSRSLGDLLDTTPELELEKLDTFDQTNDDIAVEEVSEVDVVEYRGVEIAVDMPIGTPKKNFIGMIIDKIGLSKKDKRRTSRTSN